MITYNEGCHICHRTLDIVFVLHCVLHHIALSCFALHCILPSNALPCIALRCLALYCNVLPCIALRVMDVATMSPASDICSRMDGADKSPRRDFTNLNTDYKTGICHISPVCIWPWSAICHLSMIFSRLLFKDQEEGKCQKSLMYIGLERMHVVKVNIARNNKEYQYWCNKSRNAATMGKGILSQT